MPVVAAIVTCGAFWLICAGASASVPIFSFEALPSTTEAGAHPDLEFSFELGNRQETPTPCACDDTRNVTVHLPTGVIANPHAVPQCSIAQFASDQCPVDSQIGVTEVRVNSIGATKPISGFLSPIFNLVPPPEEAGLIGFKTAFDTPVFNVASARTDSDYGLDVVVPNIDHFAPLRRVKQIIWGVPSAPTHDYLRFAPGQVPNLFALGGGLELCDQNGVPTTSDPATAFQVCNKAVSGGFAGPVGRLRETESGTLQSEPIASDSPETPYVQNPTTCGASSLETSLEILAYDEGVTGATSSYPATTNCDQLTFNPSLFAKPTTEETDSPSGIDVDLKAPEFESPSAPSPSEIRGTTVTLPPGFTINPNAADGKTSCTEAEAKLGTTEEAQCPEFAKIGTLEVHSPVLPGVLPGAVYIGRPLPDERYRLFITFDGFGVHVKLPGTVQANRQTGQIVTSFLDLPQFPFEDFDLHFFGSERGVLATPTQCGTYPVSTEFEPWDGALPNQTSTQFFTLSSGPDGAPCPNGPRPFSPGFKAASSTNTAGSHTAFSINLTRADGDQNLSALNVTTPPGFSATLKGIPYCSEAAIAAAASSSYTGAAEQANPSCPAASLVGEAIAGAGAGTHPFYAPGRVYLAGSYKGAPLSLAVITPAVSGPYDLGDVVVRVALHVDSSTAQVTAVSDPLPQILEGIPLRIRSILVNLNRPDFALNPTNCDPFSTTAKAFGNEGATASLSSPFQVANCARLSFKPSLETKLVGPTKNGTTDAFKAVLRMPEGGANIEHVAVTLPHSEFLKNAHIRTVCTRVQLASHACPAGSVYGRAKAESPLLDKPLEGPVYLGTGYGHELPDLLAELNGQIQVILNGTIDTGKGGGIRNTFEVVPDAPVSKFTLEMQGGNKGLLENSNICAQRNYLTAKFFAQNGKVSVSHPPLQDSCGGNGRHRRTNKHRRAHR